MKRSINSNSQLHIYKLENYNSQEEVKTTNLIDHYNNDRSPFRKIYLFKDRKKNILHNLCNGISYNVSQKDYNARKLSYINKTPTDNNIQKHTFINGLQTFKRPVSSKEINVKGINLTIRRNQFPNPNIVNRKFSKLLVKKYDNQEGIKSTSNIKILSTRKIPQRNIYNSTKFVFSKDEKLNFGLTINQKFSNPNDNLESFKKEQNLNLLLSCKLGNYEKVRGIIKNKLTICMYDINCVNKEGFSPLHLSIIGSYSDIVKLLLKANAKIEQRTKDKKTPFHLVCIHGNLEIARILLYFGADVQAKDLEKNTPSHYAALKGNTSILRLILEKRPELTSENIEGKTAVDMAANIQIIKVFEKYLCERKDFGLSEKLSSIYRKFKEIEPGSISKIIGKKSLSIETKLNNFVNNQNLNNQKEIISIKEIKDIKSPEIFISRKIDLIHPFEIDEFKAIELIGKGTFGKVFLLQSFSNKKLYALKLISKEKTFIHNMLKYPLTERNILCKSDHPLIIKLYWAFQTTQYLALVTNYCPGGDLSKFLKKENKMTEELARLYIAEIISSIEYLHSKNIIYRDLKPENILIDKEGHAILSDFGLSKELISNELQSNSFCGTIPYIAPEVIRKETQTKVIDWYSVGCLLYEFLCGYPPFGAKSKDEIYNNILNGNPRINNDLSNVSKNFILSLTNKNPVKRLGYISGAEEIKKHNFLKTVNWDDIINGRSSLPKPRPRVIYPEHINLRKILYNPNKKNWEDVPQWNFP